MFLDGTLWRMGIDTLTDAVKIFPFLFLTYLIMEYIEHRAGEEAEGMILKAGRFGPLLGGILGIVPQCGFSASAASLYAGRIITLGTLLSIFLSTSDEMLPIFISAQVPAGKIVKILGLKMLIGILAGILIDFFMQKRETRGGQTTQHLKIEEMCDHENCNCGKEPIWKSALKHSVQIIVFIMIISFLITVLISIAGEERLTALLNFNPFLGPALAGVIGLIPNCAASVLLTQLYLDGLLQAGSLMSGLLVGAGVGLLILFRLNGTIRENIRITLLLYGIGVFTGIIMETAGLVI